MGIIEIKRFMLKRVFKTVVFVLVLTGCTANFEYINDEEVSIKGIDLYQL